MKTFVSALVATAEASKACPIGKIVGMLKEMKGQVQAEGEVQQDQFNKYGDWCASQKQELSYLIEKATSERDAAAATNEQGKADAGASSADKEDAIAKLNKASAELAEQKKLRSSQKKNFNEAETELEDSLDTLKRAVRILSRVGKSSPGVAMQQLKEAMTQVSSGLAVVVNAAFLDTQSKKKLQSLLEDDDDLPSGAPSGASYESHSTGIIDTLVDLKNQAETQLTSLRKEEMSNKHSFEMLQQGLNNDIATHKKSSDAAGAAEAEASETAANAQRDADSAAAQLKQSSQYHADTSTACDEKAALWERISAERVAESAAIDKAISILQSDEFNAAKTSQFGKEFLQVKEKASRTDTVRTQVSNYLMGMATKLHSVGLAQLASRTKADAFGKVKQLISDMIKRLIEQSHKEASQQQFCVETKAKNEKKQQQKTLRHEKVDSRLETAKTSHVALVQKISDLQDTIAEENKSYAEASTLRSDELSDYKVFVKDYSQFQVTIEAALKALQEYYANAAFVQQPSFDGPVFDSEYSKKGDLASGPVALLETCLSKVTEALAQRKAAESEGSSQFDKMKNDYNTQKASLGAELSGSENTARALKSSISENTEDLNVVEQELTAIGKALTSLRERCVYQAPSFEERAAKREAEIAGLRNVLEILGQSSFLQK